MTFQRLKEHFRAFSTRASAQVGSPWAFIAAASIVVGWAASGPFFRFSDTWQLVINTGTTIVTFLMVFLIQNTQNRDARAMHLKLDELIRVMRDARDDMIDLEDAPDAELRQVSDEFRQFRNGHAFGGSALPGPPVPAPHQHHQARDQEQADHRGVEHHAEHQREPQ